MEILKYKTANEALHILTDNLIVYMEHLDDQPRFNLALSGGETAKQLFKVWREDYASLINWNKIRFFWVDERCVSPDSPESNYGIARQLLLEPLNIPHAHVYRIWGEERPEDEAKRYADELRTLLPSHRGVPYFDAIILGVGTDLHTASIFPGQTSLLVESDIYAAGWNPYTMQRRVTITGTMLLNGTPLLVPILGEDKASVLDSLSVIDRSDTARPAVYILSCATKATVFASV